MLLIHKSILKELVVTITFAILFLNFILMTEKLLRITRMLSGGGTSFLDVTKIILYLQPETLILTIPMALLLSVLLTYGRLAADNELTILKNTGLSFAKITKPVIYLGVICFILNFMMSFYLGPKGSSMLREKVSEILTKRAALTIEEGIFNTAFKDIVILVKEKPSKDVLREILIFDERKKDEQRLILAHEGLMEMHSEGMSFVLMNGKIYLSKKDSLTEIHFQRYQFVLTLTSIGFGRKRSEMTPFELLDAAKSQSEGKSKLLTEFHRRLSMPALCLIIIFLAPPLSLLSGKSVRLGGLTIGLALFTFYYMILLYGENLALAGKISYFVGSWMAFGILGILSLILFYKANKR